MLKSLEILADLLKNAVLEELQAQEGGSNALVCNKSLDKKVVPSIACVENKNGGKHDNKTA